jgi:ArsR family transcriptional regulator, lead/cadmium/zinc/bismuth-responsive transcriptional repressor
MIPANLLCLDLERRSACAESAYRSRRPRLATFARALADPTRLAIAAALAGSDELCVCDLAWVMQRTQNLVSHRARALRAAGLVRSRREGKMVMYALTAQGRRLLVAVLTTREPARS